eukprot:jgi/Ulvmu1/11679/UM008_0089.1
MDPESQQPPHAASGEDSSSGSHAPSRVHSHMPDHHHPGGASRLPSVSAPPGISQVWDAPTVSQAWDALSSAAGFPGQPGLQGVASPDLHLLYWGQSAGASGHPQQPPRHPYSTYATPGEAAPAAGGHAGVHAGLPLPDPTSYHAAHGMAPAHMFAGMPDHGTPDMHAVFRGGRAPLDAAAAAAQIGMRTEPAAWHDARHGASGGGGFEQSAAPAYSHPGYPVYAEPGAGPGAFASHAEAGLYPRELSFSASDSQQLQAHQSLDPRLHDPSFQSLSGNAAGMLRGLSRHSLARARSSAGTDSLIMSAAGRPDAGLPRSGHARMVDPVSLGFQGSAPARVESVESARVDTSWASGTRPVGGTHHQHAWADDMPQLMVPSAAPSAEARMPPMLHSVSTGDLAVANQAGRGSGSTTSLTTSAEAAGSANRSWQTLPHFRPSGVADTPAAAAAPATDRRHAYETTQMKHSMLDVAGGGVGSGWQPQASAGPPSGGAAAARPDERRGMHELPGEVWGAIRAPSIDMYPSGEAELPELQSAESISHSMCSSMRLDSNDYAQPMPGRPRTSDPKLQSDHLNRLKALLSQCEPTTNAFVHVLLHCGVPCTLPLITKLVSKFNKSGQWRRGLALYWALPVVGLEADAQMANAALGSCARGGDAAAAWALYRFMASRTLALDTVSFRTLLAALRKGGLWQQCLKVFMHAVEAGVQLEASSIMNTIVAMDRAGRWELAEAVFTSTMLCICDLTTLMCLPLDAASDRSATAAARGAIDSASACAVLEGIGTAGSSLSARPAGAAAGLDADAARSRDSGAQAGSSADLVADIGRANGAPSRTETQPGAPSRTETHPGAPSQPGGAAGGSGEGHAAEGQRPAGGGVQPPSQRRVHVPNADEDGAAASLMQQIVVLRWRLLSHRDSGVSRTALLSLLQAEASAQRMPDVPGSADAPADGRRSTHPGLPIGLLGGVMGPAAANGNVAGGLGPLDQLAHSDAGIMPPARGPLLDKSIRALRALRKDVLTRACCHAVLLAYRHASVPPVTRADQLLSCMRETGGAVAPDIVSCNIVIDMHACLGDLRGGLSVLMHVFSAALEPTPATFAPLLQAAVRHGDFDSLQVCWHLMDLMRSAAVEPDSPCTDALLAAAALEQGAPQKPPPAAAAAADALAADRDYAAPAAEPATAGSRHGGL